MIQFPAYLSGFSSRTDGSAGIRITTQELGPDDFAALQGTLNQFGYFLFSPNKVQDEEIPDEDAEENKKPSQRLRAVLYRLWEQQGKNGTFESFYREKMEMLITTVKGKLD